MKPQDILFIIVLFILILFKRSAKIATFAGLCCVIIAIPLFAKWIFFTAERLIWYGAGFFLLAIIYKVKESK